MDISTRWWLRRCLKCQARKTSCQTIRWPTFSLPLPNGPCIFVSVDHLGPLPLTPRGNAYILLYTDHFSRRTDRYTTAEAQFTAPGTADILVDCHIPLWGCTATLLSDNGPRFCAKLSLALYDRFGINKIATSSYHPCTNGGIERVNHTTALMLAMVGDEQQTDWDIQLPHAESAYKARSAQPPDFSALHGNTDKTYTPPASHPPLLVRHPFTMPPVQPLLRQMRIGGASAGPGRNISCSRVQLPPRTLWFQRFSSNTLPSGTHL